MREGGEGSASWMAGPVRETERGEWLVWGG